MDPLCMNHINWQLLKSFSARKSKIIIMGTVRSGIFAVKASVLFFGKLIEGKTHFAL